MRGKELNVAGLIDINHGGRALICERGNQETHSPMFKFEHGFRHDPWNLCVLSCLPARNSGAFGIPKTVLGSARGQAKTITRSCCSVLVCDVTRQTLRDVAQGYVEHHCCTGTVVSAARCLGHLICAGSSRVGKEPPIACGHHGIELHRNTTWRHEVLYLSSGFTSVVQCRFVLSFVVVSPTLSGNSSQFEFATAWL